MILNNANTDLTFYYWMSAAPLLALIAWVIFAHCVQLATGSLAQSEPTDGQ